MNRFATEQAAIDAAKARSIRFPDREWSAIESPNGTPDRYVVDADSMATNRERLIVTYAAGKIVAE